MPDSYNIFLPYIPLPMKNTSNVVTLLWLAVVWGIVLVTTTSTLAFWGNWTRWVDRDQLQVAIEANDYSLLTTETQEKIDAENFSEMVEQKAQHEARRDQMEAAVAAENFEAFSLLQDTYKAEMKVMKEARLTEKLSTATPEEKVKIEARIAKRSEKESNRGEKTEEKKIKKFNKLVTYYKENGTLPERVGKGRGHKKNGAKRGGRNNSDGNSVWKKWEPGGDSTIKEA